VDDDRKAVLVRITGLVQGVYYRAWAQAEAKQLGLHGWVRNEEDGSVRTLICGPAAAVSAMTERMRSGPPDALVADLVVEEANPADASEGFRIMG
jgi:acylphosphatase